MRRALLLTFLLLTDYSAKVSANDTIWTQAHRNTQLDWYNNFDVPVQFPSGDTSYRKIQMLFTLGKYICPGNPQYCSDWDYKVQVFIMTPTGDTFEIGKLITPYAKGPRMPEDWKGTYVFDVTDYYPVLKNNVSVRIHYAGYSGGFTADIRFAFIKGARTRNVLRIDPLWQGNFDYGNPADPIENNITAISQTVPPGTAKTEMKFNISGHGGDDLNCAEFCRKSYRLTLNGTEISRKEIWREDCGSNYLYPQSGTWVYNRANWCPGNLVPPNIHTIPGLNPGDHYSIDADFDAHTSTTNQPDRHPASYTIAAALFHYGDLNKNLDLSLTDIIAPSAEDRFFRENERCGSPVIRVQNTGRTPISSIRFAYGVNNDLTEHVWHGTLASLETTEITLPELYDLRAVAGKTDAQKFTVRIEAVNGVADEDRDNDEITSAFTPVPRWPVQFVVSLKTNNATTGSISQSGWAIYNTDGAILKERRNLSANTTYTDTITAGPGCYKLEVTDAGCDGISWWANPGAGRGSVSVTPLNSTELLPLRGYMFGDFGCGFTQYFATDWPASILPEALTFSNPAPRITVYPNPTQHEAHILITEAPQTAGTIHVLDIAGRIIAQHPYQGKTVIINTSEYSGGIYTIMFTGADGGRDKAYNKLIIEKGNN